MHKLVGDFTHMKAGCALTGRGSGDLRGSSSHPGPDNVELPASILGITFQVQSLSGCECLCRRCGSAICSTFRILTSRGLARLPSARLRIADICFGCLVLPWSIQAEIHRCNAVIWSEKADRYTSVLLNSPSNQTTMAITSTEIAEARFANTFGAGKT